VKNALAGDSETLPRHVRCLRLEKTARPSCAGLRVAVAGMRVCRYSLPVGATLARARAGRALARSTPPVRYVRSRAQ
jgi:hypothetical protein